MKSKILKIVKTVVCTVLFLTILASSLLFFMPLFRYDEDVISSGNMAMFYAQDKDTIDVAFVGSSALYRFISPTEMYQNYGVTSMNFATANMNIYAMPGVIEELVKYQHPKVIVIEIRNYINNAEREMHGGEYSKEELAKKESMFNRLVNNMPVSLTRAKIIKDTVPEMLGQSTLEWNIEYLKTHTNWKNIKGADIKYFLSRYVKREVQDYDGEYYGADYKGTVARHWVYYNEDRDFSDFDTVSEISGKWLEKLQKTVDAAKECGTNVMFLTTPYPTKETKVSYENFVEKYLTEQGVHYLNCNRRYDEIGIDFSSDFYDDEHSNTQGIVKVTNYLAKHIIDYYKLEKTELTEAQAKDWQTASDKWVKEVREPGLKKVKEYVAKEKAKGNKNYLD